MQFFAKPRVLVLFLLTLIFLANPVWASKQSTAPTTNQGVKWRIGYLEGGAYVDYPFQLRSLIKGLMRLGWLESAAIPIHEGSMQTDYIWKWLSEKCKSDYLEFVSDAYWANGWNEQTRKKNKTAIFARLNKDKSLDMMLAMGTWAGQDLANDQHAIPTMVMSSSNPILSNIIISAKDSGRDHIHAKIDPMRYIRQIELFSDIFNFKVLGLVYENSVEGRTYSALADVEQVAKQHGFSIIKCEAPYSGVSEKEAAQKVTECHEQLAPKIDAFYITTHLGIDKKYMDKLMAPFLKYQVPTWSQRGAEEVEYGALMSFSRANFIDVGMFQAEVMAKILNGTHPRDIPQIFYDPKETIAFNLQTAKLIEFNPTLDILAAADLIYEEIKKYSRKPSSPR